MIYEGLGDEKKRLGVANKFSAQCLGADTDTFEFDFVFIFKGGIALFVQRFNLLFNGCAV